ncbi:RNA Binding Fox-1-like protein [Temnothorax longispinosus]|uniref:RNA Binding Fox-1-like protein n=1 Tax=Temnothorax longispinosus TaxID=300112 RepID=A0A4S2KSC6_9HYME|nr:RNA Binding Fox-1-like protein [Temnothorax longispinosus]
MQLRTTGAALIGYRLPAMPWSWLGAAAPSAATAAAVAAAAVTPSPAAAPLVLAPRAAARRSVYYDPFLAAHAATQDPNYRLQAAAAAAAASPLLKTPLSTAQQATYAAAATYTAVAARAYGAAAAAAQPVAGYAAVAGQQYTEVATTGSRHTKWIVDSRAREPSKLYSAEHDQTQVDTIITVIYLPSSRSPTRRRA